MVAADLLRDDSGFVATTAMGIALANQRSIDVALMLDFQQTLVQLLVGVLFILIAASVSPADVAGLLPEALALVAIMAFVIRPAVVALPTWGSSLSLRERAFVAWMAPRGIVAGASASAFAVALEQDGIAGADVILPIVFIAIFAAVVLYGADGRAGGAPAGGRRDGRHGRARGGRPSLGPRRRRRPAPGRSHGADLDRRCP